MEKHIESKQTPLNSLDVSNLIAQIDEYEQKYGLLSSTLNAYEISEENDFIKGMTEKSKNLLDVTGLGFVSVETQWMKKTLDGHRSSIEMRLEIKEGRKFLEYLKALDPDSITEEQRQGLVKLDELLSHQLGYVYDVINSENDEMLELLINARAIVEEYKRLSVPVKLEEYSPYIEKRCLREYLLAKRFDIAKPMLEGGGYDLLWYRGLSISNVTPEILGEKWNEIIKAIKLIKKNDDARKIYEQALDTAKDAAALSLEEISEMPDDDERKDGFNSVLVMINKQLSEFEK